MRRWLPWVAVAALLLWQKSCADRQAGALEARIAAARQRETQLLAWNRERDTVYLWRTEVQQVVRHTTDTILATDTLWRSDTVRALIAGERLACDAVILTCEQRVAGRDSLILNLRQQLGLERKKRPGLFAHLGRSAALLGIGFGAAKILSR